MTISALVFLNDSLARGTRTAVAVGSTNANFLWVVLLAFWFFREPLQPSRLEGLAATPMSLWLMGR